MKAFDSKGKALVVTRPDPYQWNVSGHDGTVKFTYTLFGNRGDGTYLQIDETHAHLNMPATFAFARNLDYRPIKVSFKVRDDLHWKVATQLKPLDGNNFFAPDLQYLMDSPTEISNFTLRQFEEQSNGKTYAFRIALHHLGREQEADEYLAGVKKIVGQEIAVMGALPDFDFGTYTFLGCYMPQASGDGMEHRNSTYVIGSVPLTGDGMLGALSTVSHEFFHCWNVERIRPAALEPFDFERANMSAELWFAEGFTSYYTGLFLRRAGLQREEDYIKTLSNAINAVSNSPARSFYNPIGMSCLAPFADHAASVDPTNLGNTFISYYTYGEAIGLALDLSLRNLNISYSLDGFMKLVWTKYGITESPYTVLDLKAALAEYVTPAFATDFFDHYIFQSALPDYGMLLATMGVSLEKASPGKAYVGASFVMGKEGVMIEAYCRINTPAYKAGLERGDVILSIDGNEIKNMESVSAALARLTPGKEVKIEYQRLNEVRKCSLKPQEDPSMQTKLVVAPTGKARKETTEKRTAWLSAK